MVYETEQFFPVAKRVFKQRMLVIFVTHNTVVCDEFIREWPFGLVVKLSKLTVDDIKSFLSQRWKALAPSTTHDHPFDLQAIESVFGESSLEFQTVMNYLAAIFSFHLDA